MARETARIGANGIGVDVVDGAMATYNPVAPAGTAAAPVTTQGVKGTPTDSRVTTGADAVAIAAAPTRKSVTFQNIGAADIWLTTSGAASASIGFKLEPGKSLVDEATTSAWRCFSATASTLAITQVV